MEELILCKICGRKKGKYNKNDTHKGLCINCYHSKIFVKKCLCCKKIFVGKYLQELCSKKCMDNREKIKYKELQKIKDKENKCRLCNSISNIHKHHIIMKKYKFSDNDDTMMLCNKCHVNIHKYYNVLDIKGYTISKNY